MDEAWTIIIIVCWPKPSTAIVVHRQTLDCEDGFTINSCCLVLFLCVDGEEKRVGFGRTKMQVNKHLDLKKYFQAVLEQHQHRPTALTNFYDQVNTVFLNGGCLPVQQIGDQRCK